MLYLKLARFRVGSYVDWGVVVEGYICDRSYLSSLCGLELPNDLIQFLTHHELVSKVLKTLSNLQLDYCISLSSVKLLPPVPKPSKMVFIGLNYQDHAREVGAEIPKEPVIFLKPPSAIIGPYDNIVIPRRSRKVDYEGELAVVIGRRAKSVDREEALNYVAGYMVMNDVTARDVQKAISQWDKGKGFDTFAPCGPWLVTTDEIPDPHTVKITTKVNGVVKQDSGTWNMIFKVPDLIQDITDVMTLEPGDIISTGTPSGVGYVKGEFLNPGDVVEVCIDRIGCIKNKVVAGTTTT
ncbi:MAG: fumarylacetoacetate hydrolase family protein [Sulfolobales archaeon]